MINRDILLHAFQEDSFPNFTCPNCNSSILVPANGVKHSHPQFSQRIQSELWSDVEMVELRICTTLICSSPTCGDEVSFYAHGSVYQDYGFDGETINDVAFNIKSIFPSPWIINIPDPVPPNVKEALLSSFNSFWFDKALSANALRRSLEFLLAHLEVPEEIDGKRLWLKKRIEILEDEKPEDADFYSAIKKILDKGSHQTISKPDDLLDAFEAYEIYLDRLFDQRTSRLNELKDKLKEH